MQGGAHVRERELVARHVAKDLQGARDALDRAIELAPDYAPALGARGDVRRALGDREGAIADYDAFLRLSPTAPVARNITIKKAQLEAQR